MKSTMNKMNIARMNLMLDDGVSMEKISSAIGVTVNTMKRFLPKKVAPKLPPK